MARFFWAALCAVVFVCVLTFPAHASDPQRARGVVCDTPEQIAMFGSLVDEKGAHGALAAVNEEAKDPLACIAADFVYIKIKSGAIVRAGGKDWVVTEVQVIAVMTPAGMSPIEPKTFYVLTAAEDRPA